ncbi:MAG: hypothetical protein ACOWW1_00360 [archaeon]
MLNFDPNFTEVIFLDIEGYVPPEMRQQHGASLIFNPGINNHFVLGGVFYRTFPLQKKKGSFWQVWNWSKDEEKKTLQQIYNYFKESWKMIEEKTKEHPDLILVGTGISRFDIPTIYVRSTLHKIDSEVALYETYFKTKIVDLTDVGIPIFRKNPNVYRLYPKTTNALKRRFRIEEPKTSGTNVWKLYDEGHFDAIKERTTNEVKDIIAIANKIKSLKMR